MNKVKLLIEIDEEEYETLSSLSDREKVNDLIGYEKIIANGIPLDGTNGKVLMKMFPPSVYFPSDGTYMALLAKDCLVSCSNMDWWNADYKGESEDV